MWLVVGWLLVCCCVVLFGGVRWCVLLCVGGCCLLCGMCGVGLLGFDVVCCCVWHCVVGCQCALLRLVVMRGRAPLCVGV